MNLPILMGVRSSFYCAFLAGVLLLTACSSKPPVPDWQMNAQDSSRKALEAYLSGNTRVEALEWDRARSEVARTGRPDLLARLELLRCAAELASLVVGTCERFEALRTDALPAEQAYASYLAGRIEPAQVPLLPEAQRKVAVSGDVPTLANLADPLARLVAAGVLFQTGRASPTIMQEATEVASAQGWRRPLMAWLMLQMQRAEAAGDTQTAEALRRRIAIATQTTSLR